MLRVLFHPKQLMLYSAGDDTDVRVWDLVTKSCTVTLKGHYSAVTSLSLSPDGWLLLSGGRDKVVMLWDLRTGAKLATVPVYEAVEGVVALPLGAPFPGVPPPDTAKVLTGASKVVHFATAGEKGQIKIWSSQSGSCVYALAVAGAETALAANASSASRELVDLQLLPGGGGLMAATADARLLCYAPTAAAGGSSSKGGGRGGSDRQLALCKQLIGNIDEVTDVRFVGPADQPTHLAVATNGETVRLFELASMSCSASLGGHRDIVMCLDAAALQPADLAAHGCSEAAAAAAAAAGGRFGGLLVSGGKDNEVRAWSTTDGRCLGVGVGHVAAVTSVAIAPKGRKFVVSVGADKLVKVWDLAPVLKAVAALAAGGGTSGSGDGGEAAVAAAAPRLQLRVSAAIAAHDKDINAVAVAPNDQLVATASQDRSAKLWRLPDLVPVVTLRGHKKGVWSVAFSPVEKVRRAALQLAACACMVHASTCFCVCACECVRGACICCRFYRTAQTSRSAAQPNQLYSTQLHRTTRTRTNSPIV